MYTDFYFTNKSSLFYKYTIALFQKQNTLKDIDKNSFEVIKNCPFDWSNKVRICWNISFRLVDQFNNLSPVYYLDQSHTKCKKTCLLFKEGTIILKKSSLYGNLIVEFEQTKGNKIQAVHFYRGNLLVEKILFENKRVKFESSTIISLAQYTENCVLQSMIDIDFNAQKAIYINLKGDQNTENKLQIIKQDKW